MPACAGGPGQACYREACPRHRMAERHRSPGRTGRRPMSDTQLSGPALDGAGPPEFSKRGVVMAVVRRGGPKLLEATIIPGALFYLCLIAGGLGFAYLTAIA